MPGPTPEQIAKNGSEHAEQAALFAWAASTGWVELRWLFAIPNGGERNQIVAGKMKAEGVKKGVFDICLPFPSGRFAGLFIEMKKRGREREKNGGLSDEQLEFEKDIASYRAYATARAYSWEQAASIIQGYLAHGTT